MKLALLSVVLILGAISCMAGEPTKKEKIWYTGEVQHEGFPLHLRFPEKPDFDGLQKKFPRLLVVTHVLAKVTSSGVPEASYNESLAEFDHELITAFDSSALGVPVLVETFGGKRTYYLYVSTVASVNDMKRRFASKYPQHHLQWELRDDVNWKFIRSYSADYGFYKKR